MKRILIVGAGFAGVWSALSAARLLDKHGIGPDEIELAVVAPRASLDLRPRFYEPDVATMTSPVGPLFDAVGVKFVAGTVEAIDPEAGQVSIVDSRGERSAMAYDRLILASGSRLVRPAIPGLADYAFSIDQIDEAAQLETHLHGLAARPDNPPRNTAIVIGGGFTGVEIATELPARMRAILGDDAPVHVIVIERSDVIGPELGAGPRPVIVEALASQGVECLLGTSVTHIDAGGVCTTAGERIDSLTVLWTGGMHASALTRLLPGERDPLGRLRVDRDLRLPAARHIFAAGDTACAATDDEGNHSLMSCQHALMLGRFAGHNAAADLIGADLLPYTQERYVTCLDLGPWGSVVTAGWERAVQFAGPAAKEQKRYINSVAIAPPPPVRSEALAAADPLLKLAPSAR
ncbi:MAG TPA: FAD-dependent oxidoreductase [Sphingomonadaceae bacterium]|nr:FAD-dependent oxidoreductase [Sphingomonadaceae bacterium]